MADVEDPTADAPPRVIVVGGGVAGLVMARELVNAGVRVTLVEASGRLGGKLRPLTIGGIELDAGAESFATRDGTVARLATEIGLGDSLVAPAPAGAWIYPLTGRALPLPVAGLLGIPSVPLARDVINVVGLPGALRAQLDALLSGFVGSKERNLGRLVRKRMGAAMLDRLVAPVVSAIHSVHPDELDVDIAAPRLRAAVLSEGSLARGVATLREAAPAGSAVQGIAGGVFRLADALAAGLVDRAQIMLDTRVVEADATGVTLADGTVLAADRVVVAAELDAAGELDAAELDAAHLDTAGPGSAHLDTAGPGPATFDTAGPGSTTFGLPELGDSSAGPVSTELGDVAAHPTEAARRDPVTTEHRDPAAAITIVTLLVRAPGLDSAPRGSGVIVVSGAPGVTAKALTHATAKWSWLAGVADGSHVLRLSYSSAVASEGDLTERARLDAEILLGVDIPALDVLACELCRWTVPATRAAIPGRPVERSRGGDDRTPAIPDEVGHAPGHAPDAVVRIGEGVSGVGLAAVVGQATSEAAKLLRALSGVRGLGLNEPQ